MAYTKGDIMRFRYPNFATAIQDEGMAEYAKRSGQFVTIIEVREDAFQDCDGNACRGFIIQTKDGWCGTAWPGELSET